MFRSKFASGQPFRGIAKIFTAMPAGAFGLRNSAPPTFRGAKLMRAAPLRRLFTILLPALALVALAAVAGLLWLPASDQAQAQTAQTVPADWPLIPGGVESGDSFRLLFVTSATREASSSNIADYNTHAQSAAGGNDNLKPFKGGFTALISTSAVDAKDNTATTGTGVPVHWLGGEQVADDYADLYDKSWDSVAGRTESGGSYTGLVWTGGNKAGEKSGQRYAGAAEVRLGDLSDPTMPLSSPQAAASGGSYPLYAISPVLTVAEPEPEPTATPTPTPQPAPSITAGPAIVSSPARGDTYGQGQTIRVAVTFSEAVTVTGEPRVRLNMGDRTRWARYVSTSADGTALTFDYSVQDNDQDANGISIKTNQLQDGTIADADGNAANLDHPALPDQSGHKVDGFRPEITAGPAITSSPASGDTYGEGQAIQVAVTFSEAVTVTGEPRVRLTVGDRTRWARYASSSSNGTVLTFAYPVKGSDQDENGISIKQNQLELRDGTIADAGGNAAKLKYPALSDQSGHKVDGSLQPAHGEPVEPPADGEQQQPQPPSNSPPEFSTESATRSVREDTLTRSVGDAITATDNDAGDTLTYTLSGADASDFEISAAGALSFVRYPDYENPHDVNTDNVYEVTVNVSDGKNAAGAVDNSVDDTIAVAITVTNVNELPRFGLDSLTVHVLENTAPGAAVGSQVGVTDPDANSEYNTLTYTLTGSSDFTIDSGGQIRVAAGVTLDYETTKRSYAVTVGVSDGKDADGAADNSIDARLSTSIIVYNVDESGSVTLNPTSPTVGTAVAASLADPDGHVTGTTWAWQRSADRNTWSTIDGATLAAYTPSSSDAGNYLRATASYTDGHGPGKTANGTTASPVPGAPPTPTPTPTPKPNSQPSFDHDRADRHVSENTPIGTNFGDPVTATDLDGDTLTYTMTAAPESWHKGDVEFFDVDAGTGQIKVKKVLSYEIEEPLPWSRGRQYGRGRSHYAVKLAVSDGKTDDGSPDSAVDDTIIVNIRVNNLNEPGVFVEPDIFTKATEVPWVGYEISADFIDPDFFQGCRYVWWEGKKVCSRWYRSKDRVNWRSPFAEDQKAYTPTAADVGYYLQVWITYRDGQNDIVMRTLEGTTTNPVAAPKNHRPRFPSMKFMRSVDENSSSGTNIGAPVTAIDPDGDDLTYGLLGPDAGSFTIDAATGQLKVKNALDYETKWMESYMVDITVSDGKNATGGADPKIDDTAWITINVNNVDEGGSVTLWITMNVDEGGNVQLRSPANPTVGTAVAATLTDPDYGVTGVTWAWERSTDRNTWETIDGGTLTTYTAVTLATYTPSSSDVGNYLRATASYTDGHGPGKTASGTTASPVAAPKNN